MQMLNKNTDIKSTLRNILKGSNKGVLNHFHASIASKESF